MSLDETVRRCDALARRLGGRVLLVCEEPSPDVASPAPSDVGLWASIERMTVYVCKPQLPGGMIHEMAHVFADRGKTIYDAQELRFLGWEYAAARQLRLVKPWLVSMTDYETGLGCAFAYLDLVERKAYLANRLRYAIRTGRVAPDGSPRNYRTAVRAARRKKTCKVGSTG